ncbi:hypothetical protein [Ralstonia chuxiongensis]|uniref:hypothetical protein n=1 Tax=Ralstonia chuxiongensis TaxID=2957504 RepID=UPI0028F5DAE2|nr:hypothetical protein [Ralstonia chuxiongensis]CAJ0784477.1 hypothetical protein R8510_05264 [Ralstonia chuxiongensis]
MKFAFICTEFLLFGCSETESSAEIQGSQNAVVPGNIPSYTPPGQVTIVPQDKLPAAMQQVVKTQVMKNIAGETYEQVPEDVFIYGLNYQSRILRDGNSEHNIKVKLAKIDNSALSTCQYEGFLPDGPTLNGPWTSVVRVFSCGAQLVMLQEWDYVSDGGGITLVKEAMNTEVGKFPAQISKKRSPSGKIMTELSWATEKRYFTLTVWTDVPRANAKKNNETTINNQEDMTQQSMLNIAKNLV